MTCRLSNHRLRPRHLRLRRKTHRKVLFPSFLFFNALWWWVGEKKLSQKGSRLRLKPPGDDSAQCVFIHSHLLLLLNSARSLSGGRSDESYRDVQSSFLSESFLSRANEVESWIVEKKYAGSSCWHHPSPRFGWVWRRRDRFTPLLSFSFLIHSLIHRRERPVWDSKYSSDWTGFKSSSP